MNAHPVAAIATAPPPHPPVHLCGIEIPGRRPGLRAGLARPAMPTTAVPNRVYPVAHSLPGRLHASNRVI